MDLRQILLDGGRKSDTEQIISYVGDDPKRFADLMALMRSKEPRICQRAAWPLSYIVRANPQLIMDYFPEVIGCLKSPAHNGVTRNMLRLLQFVSIPEEYAGWIMNHCFALLARPKEPVANQAFSMTILAHLAQRYPEIKAELLLCIEQQWPQASAGFKSRARQVQKMLDGL